MKQSVEAPRNSRNRRTGLGEKDAVVYYGEIGGVMKGEAAEVMKQGAGASVVDDPSDIGGVLKTLLSKG